MEKRWKEQNRNDEKERRNEKTEMKRDGKE